MNNCERLTTIDLSGLKELSTIKVDFMKDCKNITSIDLSILNKLNSIILEFKIYNISNENYSR